ncbi:double-stranded RNA-binding protein Staufen -like 2-like, partial [Asbolus verrucosus]
MTINELAQYNDIKSVYELLAQEGPPHNRNYKVALTLGDERYEGSGSSLKKAQQAAAESALENTYYEHPPIKIKSDQERSLTPTVILNNIAMKLGIGVSYSLLTGKEEQSIASYGTSDEAYGKSKSYFQKLNESNSFQVPTEEPQISGPFTVRVKVGDSLFTGFGHTIQAARHDAAINAIKDMEKQVLYKDNVCSSDESVNECKQKRENLKSPISRVYEQAQKRNLPVEFNVISESGKSHQKVFITQCKLGDFVSEGEGKSKKESKRMAAEKMLENLPLLPEISDGREIIKGLATKKKKKKNKTVKRTTGYFGQSVSNMLDSFWSVNDALSTKSDNTATNKVQTEHKSKPGIVSAKDKLLEMSNMLNIDVQFTDLNRYKDDFYTLMSLGVHPTHICLGKAATREKSHHVAALHGLKFLHKSGVLDRVKVTQNKDQSDYFE